MSLAPFRKLLHWGPLTAIGIIKIITAMTIHCTSMWWPPQITCGGFLNTLLFITLSGLTLYNFLSSLFHGPGYLPTNWKPVRKETGKNAMAWLAYSICVLCLFLKRYIPIFQTNEEDTKHLQFCNVCEGYKAPRSHHCKKCEKCVLKMDHHCPWINNCVGWGNHAHFTAFLAFAVLGCSQASIILACSLYRGLNRVWYLYYGTGVEPIVYLNIYTLVIGVFALGLAVGVVIAVGMLLFFQVRAIVRNRTGIEDWILEKAIHRRLNCTELFIYPYDLGIRNNARQVLTLSCAPVGDGISWPVRPDCDQFTLTREQIEQKGEKRQRTRRYQIVKPASGSWCPIFQGLSVCLHPPCTDESRIKLSVGDKINVTRWRKYWLFGDKVQSTENNQKDNKARGWFPRKCAEEVTEVSDEPSQTKIVNKKTN